MPAPDIEKLRAVKTFPSLVKYLRDDLDWPIESEDMDEVTFEWTAEELRVQENHGRRLNGGVVRQLQPLIAGQPWGIFFVEFASPQVYRTALRQILRGLVPSRRRDASLKAWQHQNLLFICATKDYDRFTFAHFKGDNVQKAKLSTFSWQSGSSYLRTLREFNLPALAWPDDDDLQADAWLAAWAKAFDKEPLTKEFFKRFDKALDAIKGDLQKHHGLNSAEAYSRGQLLLERLIFLYFLQRRGWLDQQRDYLVGQFQPHRQTPDKFTYYEGFLDKLFWTLASPQGAQERFSGIPFLNGGLFDDDEFAPTLLRRKQNPPLRIRNATFAVVFDDFLEAFNFTVREDTPLDQDVAVDPEMLGKVFESIVLHAEAADPDAVAPDKRKATGSYYTPRIVVHFICRESLYQYLTNHADFGVLRLDAALPPSAARRADARASQASQRQSGVEPPHSINSDWPDRLKLLFEIEATDGLDPDELKKLRDLLTPAEGTQLLNLLASLKCCDPAVGSGAFPVGLMHELLSLRRIAAAAANGYVDPVRKDGNVWLHETKADIVENSLYGVDIQQQAIEICRLRLWLSLIVDYDLGVDPFTADRAQFRDAIGKISQLPNLEMNFRRGDSLLDMVSNVPIRVDSNVVSRYRDHVEKIQKLGHDLHRARKAERKKNLRLEILRRRFDLTGNVLTDELKSFQTEDANLTATLFGDLSRSERERRKQIAHEIGQLQQALDKLEADRKELEKLAGRSMASDFYPKLRRLEGADFDSPFNFAWRIDFPTILAAKPKSTLAGEMTLVNEAQRQQEMTVAAVYDRRSNKQNGAHRAPLQTGGFDIVVGNPPFVTARNPLKRELYRERWPQVCHGTYLLVCPFFQMSFGLLAANGQLGFIVSNAFAKREFGKPLVEGFFPTVDVQKVLDCSGLMFPGHGTPTCIVFGRQAKPDPKVPIRVAAIVSGGGDLQTMPEESPLWFTLAEHHDDTSYSDSRVVIADRSRSEMARWPWNFDTLNEPLKRHIESISTERLSSFSPKVGRIFATSADDAFLIYSDVARRHRILQRSLMPVTEGEEIRDWSDSYVKVAVKPYDQRWELLDLKDIPDVKAWLAMFRQRLGARASFEGGSYDEVGIPWYSWHQLDTGKVGTPHMLAFTEIATHAHFVTQEKLKLFTQTSPVVKLLPNTSLTEYHLLSGLLNSNTSLFWLKQVCFSKREAEEAMTDTYYVFAGGKVEQVPVPTAIADALRGKHNALTERLTALSQTCWECGRELPSLSLKKLFEKEGEAYHGWNASLPGHVAPHRRISSAFASSASLREAFQTVVAERETLRAEMIALQEEMDWLVYAAYGLLAEDHPAVAAVYDRRSPSDIGADTAPLQLQREQRPFCLWAQAAAEGRDGPPGRPNPNDSGAPGGRALPEIYDRAIALIPADWSSERKALWKARLAAIRDNEHIRRIEQPVYKRRWDEQWKVGNRWTCGPAAYAAELVDAFNWWLAEKAEWHLEKKAGGGPLDLETWTGKLWSDARIQAAWPVIAEAMAEVEAHKASLREDNGGHGRDARATTDASVTAFARFFRDLVKDETVPEGIPPAVPWEQLEKKMRIPAKVKSIRGKLNVPRERFRLTAKDTYVWAGKP